MGELSDLLIVHFVDLFLLLLLVGCFQVFELNSHLFELSVRLFHLLNLLDFRSLVTEEPVGLLTVLNLNTLYVSCDSSGYYWRQRFGSNGSDLCYGLCWFFVQELSTSGGWSSLLDLILWFFKCVGPSELIVLNVPTKCESLGVSCIDYYLPLNFIMSDSLLLFYICTLNIFN